jgi:hypothetical protein
LPPEDRPDAVVAWVGALPMELRKAVIIRWVANYLEETGVPGEELFTKIRTRLKDTAEEPQDAPTPSEPDSGGEAGSDAAKSRGTLASPEALRALRARLSGKADSGEAQVPAPRRKRRTVAARA